MIPVVILSAIGGLIYGSFLNVLLWRLPEDRGIGGRSQCRDCGHTLAAYDLIPILSFFLLSRRCRYCRHSIHWRYPVVEATTAGAMTLLALFHPFGGTTEIFFSIAAILIFVSLFFFDLFYFILPDVIVLPAIVAWGIYVGFFQPQPFPVLISALLMASFFAILYWKYRGKNLGFGDVKLSLLIGLVLGYPLGPLTVILGIWLATVYALVLLLLKRVTMKDPVPLGAFLALATLLSVIFYHESTAIITIFQ